MTADSSPPGMLPEGGIARLRWLIDQVAAGALPVDDLIDTFRAVYEAVERAGRPQYRSKDEARLIWDVLWVLEFYSSDPGRESDPSEWNDSSVVLAVVQESAQRLRQL